MEQEKPVRPPFGKKAWALFWLGWWTGFGLLDWWRDRHGDHTTFSELLRWVFHVDHPWGKAAFIAVLGTGAVIFTLHIAWSKW